MEYYAKHKDKMTEYHRAYLKRPDSVARKRDAHFKRTYGITLVEYEVMLVVQEGVCAICRTKPEGNLFVDHCHKTGVVRGLLCRNCNAALGYLREDLEVIDNLRTYLFDWLALQALEASPESPALGHSSSPPETPGV